MAIHPLVLCGGSGTRLWPLSRRAFPKQFTPLAGDETLFQAAIRRVRGAGFAAPLVVTADEFRFIVHEQLGEVTGAGVPGRILVEPMARNTAPAILAGALAIAEKDPGGLVLALPSDHAMEAPEAFRKAVLDASATAAAGHVVTFGVAPTRPATGYGYLELATPAPADGPAPVRRFVEKPDHARAAAMLAEGESGRFFWNAGIFLFRADHLIAACREHAPAILAGAERALARARRDLDFTRLDPEAWQALPDISVDYALMERMTGLRMMPITGGWSDLGDWNAVWHGTPRDAADNAVSAHATALDCTGTLLRSESPAIELVGLGLRDIIAIATPDGVLVADRAESQRVGEVVAGLKARNAAQATGFRSHHRPWGMFESLVCGPRFQVKRIVVKPGGRLSLQSHHHRAEHWVVVEGTARIRIGDTVRLVTENESVYVPLGVIHRLENPGKLPVVLIEVQTGSYLGEDDITRHDDAYARTDEEQDDGAPAAPRDLAPEGWRR